MGVGRYILNGKIPVPCEDLIEWASWLQTNERHVGDDHIAGVHVSTVFLGLDHRLGAEGPPLLFETMIFGGQHDQYCSRSTTWELALEEHAEALELVKSSLT